MLPLIHPFPARHLPSAAKHTAADVRQRAGELAEATKERAAEAGEAAMEYTEAAREKVSLLLPSICLSKRNDSENGGTVWSHMLVSLAVLALAL